MLSEGSGKACGKHGCSKWQKASIVGSNFTFSNSSILLDLRVTLSSQLGSFFALPFLLVNFQSCSLTLEDTQPCGIDLDLHSSHFGLLLLKIILGTQRS